MIECAFSSFSRLMMNNTKWCLLLLVPACVCLYVVLCVCGVTPVDAGPFGAVNLTALYPVAQDGAAVVRGLAPQHHHAVGSDVIDVWLIWNLWRI